MRIIDGSTEYEDTKYYTMTDGLNRIFLIEQTSLSAEAPALQETEAPAAPQETIAPKDRPSAGEEVVADE